MKRSVFALLKTRVEAESVLENLKAAGISPEDISLLFSAPPLEEPSTKAPEGTATGGTSGFVLGGVLGWLAGIGALAIPGLGPFIAAGPILAALSGAAVGAALGGITGALVGLGIPEYEARQYEKKIQEGNVLVSVHAEDGEAIRRVLDILKSMNVEEIATSGEAAPESVSNMGPTPPESKSTPSRITPQNPLPPGSPLPPSGSERNEPPRPETPPDIPLP